MARTTWRSSRPRCVALARPATHVERAALTGAPCAQPEDINSYLIPPLGKHYLDRWEDEDGDRHHSQQQWHVSPLEPPVLPRLRPDALTEDALGGENVFLGPLSERLMAALAIEPGVAAGGDGEAAPGDDGEPQPKLPIDAVDLEERVKRELRYLGVLPEEDVRCSR